MAYQFTTTSKMRGKTQKKYSSQANKGRGKRDDRKTKGRDSEVSSLNNSIEDIDIDNVLDTEESRKYGRKKIESNWDRYEDPVVDENEVVYVDDYDETKDYEYIRQHSASASSHFKFKEEKEWESDLQQANKEDKNVLGLNLLQLASDLNQYGFNEKLEVNHLMPADCKYCVEGVMKDVSSITINKHPSPLHNELTTAPNNHIQWSFNGIEKYKYLIGLTNNENGKVQKPQNISITTNYSISQDNVKQVDDYSSNNSSSSCSPQDTTSPSVDSYDENDTLLDQLLMSKLSLDSYDDMRRNVKAAASNQKSKDKSKTMETEELDLDMLLESDIISSGSTNTPSNVVDSDLDQWLDDILS